MYERQTLGIYEWNTPYFHPFGEGEHFFGVWRAGCVSKSGSVLRGGESAEAAGTEASVFHPQRGGQSDGLSSELL